ncbi:hypothetical protein GWK16_06745 [Roseomonas sp. JC162]|uniref:Zinc finger/thioredoxin putative domain-containing protein n=1 Tax=Neoroseomonas marina TaxID=1232220 RepID=A0A848EBT3_9PROT|nr:zinc-ribbon domain-containing protein [Neoroseomonas marina]NMJ40930.1 hypothetical protein [Neoroseomonas marina]
MRIACPSCAATYEVPEHLLAGGPRKLRCSRCRTEFGLPDRGAPEPPAPVAERAQPVPPATPPAAPAVPEPIPVSGDDAADPPEGLVRAWILSVAAVVVAGLALVAFRADVVAAWPPAARLFTALGLA